MTRRGFTLAEVLITLVIIGVIAALTIPTLLQNKEKQETITGLKEANAIFANAISAAKTEYGDTSTWDYTLYSDAFAKQYITPHLKIGKICGTATMPPLDTGCFNAPDDSWYDMGGTLLNQANGYGRPNFYTFVLSNGMPAGFWHLVGTDYAYFLVDVNGAKGQTKIGKDIFLFTLYKNRGLAMGGYDQINSSRTDLLSTTALGGCNPNNTNSWALFYMGSACGVVILKDGWEIKNDYPW